jgi:hypothetical protein
MLNYYGLVHAITKYFSVNDMGCDITLSSRYHKKLENVGYDLKKFFLILYKCFIKMVSKLALNFNFTIWIMILKIIFRSKK